MQNKFKWHDEVIAWLSGEEIEFRGTCHNPWQTTSIEANSQMPAFYITWQYRIKPKEVIKYAGIYQNIRGATMLNYLNLSMTHLQKLIVG